MSLLSKLTKFGLAKMAIDEVRKPENQERIRRMAADAAGRARKRRGRTAGVPAEAPPAAGS